MSHKSWEDLIPFYVAQTLPLSDAAALERHLAHCPDCRQSVDEWRAIAATVRAEANRRASRLPPLSPRVSAAPQAISANGAGQAVHALPVYPRRQPRLSLTLAAALLTVLLFGGLLTLMASRLASQQDVSDATDIAAASGVTLTPRREATIMPTPTAILISSPTPTGFNTSQDLGILPSRTPRPSRTPSMTPFVVYLTPTRLSGTAVLPSTAVPPTIMPFVLPGTAVLPSTAVPPTEGLEGLDGGGMAQSQFAPAISTPPLPWPTCTVSPIGTEDVRIFSRPGADQPFMATLRAGEVAQGIWFTSGWYAVILSDGTLGWVPGAAVELNGDCNALLFPSVTPIYLPATPTAMFGSAAGYSLITTQTVGDIPANTTVTISYAWYDGSAWWYGIVAGNGQTAEAREGQIAYRPNATPTPIPIP